MANSMSMDAYQYADFGRYTGYEGSIGVEVERGRSVVQ